jgi:isoleucyl-tRNA synthetase
MEFASKEIQVQKEEFSQLGIMADWDSHQSTYRTLGKEASYSNLQAFFDRLTDHDYEIRQLRVFKDMLDKGGKISYI